MVQPEEEFPCLVNTVSGSIVVLPYLCGGSYGKLGVRGRKALPDDSTRHFQHLGASNLRKR